MKQAVIALLVSLAECLDNGLALTPPMGWMSWQRFGCEVDCAQYPDVCLSEDLIKRTADALVEGGWRDAGYEYIHIDDCWLLKDRDPITNSMVADLSRFPSGISILADYVHARGLKLGIYSDIGSKTCQGYPGLQDNFDLDAATLSEWKIDAIKVDGCYMNVSDMKDAYIMFGKSLNKTTRPILYSCSWPAYRDDHCETRDDLKTLQDSCNLWRNYDDINDSWKSVLDISRFFARPKNDIMRLSAGPGHWNDPDMLLLGNPGLSFSESEAQFGLWAMLAAPLYLSTQVDRIPDDIKRITLNPTIIAINQDPLGEQAYVLECPQLDSQSDSTIGSYDSSHASATHQQVSQDNESLTIGCSKDLRTYVKPLFDGSVAVFFFNTKNSFGPSTFTISSSQLGWPEKATMKAQDVFAYHRKDTRGDSQSIVHGIFSAQIDESSSGLFILKLFDQSINLTIAFMYF